MVLLAKGLGNASFCPSLLIENRNGNVDTDATRPSAHVSEHLANERTFLAWLRTSFGLLTLGFATNKFGQFLTELRLKTDRDVPRGLLLGSRRFGLAMVILGTLLMLVSSWNYQRTGRDIDSGDYRPNRALIWIVSILAFSFGITAIVLILQT